jgi:hypothetical protein
MRVIINLLVIITGTYQLKAPELPVKHFREIAREAPLVVK